MALKATIYKIRLHIADLDRHYYNLHTLTVARHPSENDLRLSARLLAFACFADPALEFTRGISTSEEPDLWQVEADGSIALWVELGQPETRRLRQASGRARQVVVCGYDEQRASQWLKSTATDRVALPNLQILQFNGDDLTSLSSHLRRNSEWHITLEEDTLSVSGEDFAQSVHIQRL